MIIRIEAEYCIGEEPVPLLTDAEQDGTQVPSARYQEARCHTCGKFPERAAIRKYGTAPVRADRIARDYAVSAEGLPIISQRFADLIARSGIKGLEMLRIDAGNHYKLALPNILCPVNLADSGVELRGCCPDCQRFRETFGAPAIESMAAADNELLIWSPGVPDEGPTSRRVSLYTSLKVAELLVENVITGAFLARRGIGTYDSPLILFSAAKTLCALCERRIGSIAESVAFHFGVPVGHALFRFASGSVFHRECFAEWPARAEFEALHADCVASRSRRSRQSTA